MTKREKQRHERGTRSLRSSSEDTAIRTRHPAATIAVFVNLVGCYPSACLLRLVPTDCCQFPCQPQPSVAQISTCGQKLRHPAGVDFGPGAEHTCHHCRFSIRSPRNFFESSTFDLVAKKN
ncbi:unnamed protein product [Ectocarpus sp. 8 AP-2014]